jgi:osmotically-inducible protein OsmY
MKTDADIRRDVLAELAWTPELDEKDIAVNVTGGIVTLTGIARSYYEKTRAEAAAKRVAGVAGVADDLEVRPDHDLSDPDIAHSVVAALRAQLPLQHDRIKAVVEKGHVRLEGELEWRYQSEMAATAVRNLPGVRSLNNQITIKPRVEAADVKRRIESAFHRHAQLAAQRISVDADAGVITLRGKVPGWAERDEAQRTAWAAPGVRQVRNEISVGL